MQIPPDDLQAKRLLYADLEPVCHQALLQCGIHRAELRFISDTANNIFQAKTAEQAYCVRICQQGWRDSELLGELYWLADLNKHTTLIIPKPIPTLSGDLIQKIKLPNREELFTAVLFHWIEGELIGDNAESQYVRQVGRLMGQLHNHAATFQLPSHLERERTDWLGMGNLLANMKPENAARIKAILTPNQIELCNEAASRAAATINEIDSSQNFGLIHSDLHLNNCLLTNSGIGILDFDDCQFAPFTCDLAISISDFDTFDNRDVL
ncbi:MAG: phosphotransferase, partial [Chloroflexota bacterium]